MSQCLQLGSDGAVLSRCVVSLRRKSGLRVSEFSAWHLSWRAASVSQMCPLCSPALSIPAVPGPGAWFHGHGNGSQGNSRLQPSLQGGLPLQLQTTAWVPGLSGRHRVRCSRPNPGLTLPLLSPGLPPLSKWHLPLVSVVPQFLDASSMPAFLSGTQHIVRSRGLHVQNI